MSFVEWWEKQAAAKLEANCVKYGHEICNCGVDLDTL